MDKRNKIVCIVLAVLLLAVIGITYYKDNISYYVEPIPGEEPYPKPIPIDKNFVDNEVIISFNEDTTLEEKNRFLDSLNDLESYSTIGNDIYVLVLYRTFNTRSEVNSYCKNLESNIFVKHCEPNNIIKLDDCSKGPC